MKQFLYTWLVSFIVMVPLDGLWLNIMGERFYKPYLGYIFAEEFNYLVGLVFYLIYSFGITYLILTPFINTVSLSSILIKGCVLGCIAYGAYDLTNQATLKNWPVIVTVVDMLWGTAVTGLTSLIACVILKKYF